MPKRSIRSKFLAQRKSLSDETRHALSDEIQKRLIDSGCLNEVSCVALYSAINNEVHMGRFAEFILQQGKRLAYPRISGDELDFFEVANMDDLAPGSFGVMEPKGSALVPSEDLHIVVVPGVVFDLSGHRLGYGRGYYDRALERCTKKCRKIGVAYDFQVIDKLPTLEHDQVLTQLITEKRTITFNAR
jgi:5-formyltetrahydrofolate cyclo-ligase